MPLSSAASVAVIDAIAAARSVSVPADDDGHDR